jgi:Tol biopolymer transport system component
VLVAGGWTNHDRAASPAGTVVFAAAGQVLLADSSGGHELHVSPPQYVDTAVASPDERRLAYLSIDRQDADLWVSDLTGGHAVLIRKADSETVPVWSPDSRQLAFVSHDAAWVATVPGRAVHRLGPVGIEQAFAWSPDGRELSYWGSAGLTLYDSTSGRKRVLARDSRVWQSAWTPDGLQVVYWGRGGIYSVETSGPRPRTRLLVAQGRDFALSPDGRSLAYDRHVSLYLRPFDGSRRPRLIADEFDDFAWAPDSRTLAFSRKDSRRFNAAGIYLAQRSGGAPRPLLADLGLDGARLPSWSPDSARIVYERVEQGYRRLYVVELNGRDDRQLLAEDPEAVPDAIPVSWLAHPIALPADPPAVTVKPDQELQAGGWVSGIRAGPDLALVTAAYPLSEYASRFTALFWKPSTGGKAEPSLPCEDEIVGVALAGDRYAYVCETYDAQTLFELYVAGTGQALPDKPLLSNDESGVEGGSVAGDGNLLAAEIGDTLYRIDGIGSPVALRRYAAPATVLGVDHDRILLATSKNSVEVVAADGSLLASLSISNAYGALFRDGKIATVDDAGNLAVHDLAGQPPLLRPLPTGAQLEDISGDLVLLDIQSRQHLLRLSDGRDVTLRLPGQFLWAWACFDAGGIDYAYNTFGPVSHRLGYLAPESVTTLLG